MFLPPVEDGVRVGDLIKRVNQSEWQALVLATARNPFDGYELGEQISLLVEREGAEVEARVHVPRVTGFELSQRVNSQWWLPYVFWFAALATMLLIRPKRLQRRLLVAFLLITAVWLSVGTVASLGVWHARVAFRVAIWLSVPIYIQLHFVQSHIVERVPERLVAVPYLVTLVLIVFDLLGYLPPNAYLVAFGLVIIISLALLFVAVIRGSLRAEGRWLLFGLMFALVPFFVVAAVGVSTNRPEFQGGALLGVVAIPGIYFLSGYQPQLPKLRTRIWRLINLYVVLVLVLVLLFVAATFGIDWLDLPGSTLIWGGVAVTLSKYTGALVGFGFGVLTLLCGAILLFHIDLLSPTGVVWCLSLVWPLFWGHIGARRLPLDRLRLFDGDLHMHSIDRWFLVVYLLAGPLVAAGLVWGYSVLVNQAVGTSFLIAMLVLVAWRLRKR